MFAVPIKIDGQFIRSLGYAGAAWFKTAIADAKDRAFASEAEARLFLDSYLEPTVAMRAGFDAGQLFFNIDADTADERANVEAVRAHMEEIMRLPTVVAGAVMPDACPVSRTLGVIPVGGVIKAKDAIHPSMHSADICCSMAISVFPADTDPTALLDAGMKLSHFGAGGRDYSHDMRPSTDLLDRMERNPFLSMLGQAATRHFGTQGDGNHFFYVGRLRSDERIALVTHHGSRKPGAELYKRGMAAAEKYRRKHAPEIPEHNAWIPASGEDGERYWEALQIVRQWTKANHFAIHDLVTKSLGLKVKGRFWNEHNFVFERDGFFYHGKGATPAWAMFAADSVEHTLIPLNMAEPILIVKGLDAPHALGFSPHGAGRNLSRTAFNKLHAGKTPQQMIAEQAPGIDVRYFNGTPDVSELPAAYKNAKAVMAQIEKYRLAEVVDQVLPIGNIMAGETSWKRG